MRWQGLFLYIEELAHITLLGLGFSDTDLAMFLLIFLDEQLGTCTEQISQGNAFLAGNIAELIHNLHLHDGAYTLILFLILFLLVGQLCSSRSLFSLWLG